MGITGNARGQEQLRSAEKLALVQREADLKELLSLPSGRRFLWDLIDRRCNVHGTGYSASGSETYFLLGQRDVGVTLRGDIQRADHKAYARMLIESVSAAEDQRRQVESAQAKVDTEVEDEDDGE
jgi:hypothetical protein